MPAILKPSAARVIAVAASQVGYHEGRSNGHWNNNQKYSKQVPGLAWSNWQPWCDTFVAWCFWKSGALDLLPGGPTASVAQSIARWKHAGRWSAYPAIGAQVCYGNGAHTGIVERYDGTYIYTIEGNTNTSGSAEGDGVYRKVRYRRDAYVTGYGYPDYPEGIASADPKWQTLTPTHTTTPTVQTPDPSTFLEELMALDRDTAESIIANGVKKGLEGFVQKSDVIGSPMPDGPDRDKNPTWTPDSWLHFVGAWIRETREALNKEAK